MRVGLRADVSGVQDPRRWWGLFGRGLGTRIGTNALQAVLFTVIWKLLEAQIEKSGILG